MNADQYRVALHRLELTLARVAHCEWARPVKLRRSIQRLNLKLALLRTQLHQAPAALQRN